MPFLRSFRNCFVWRSPAISSLFGLSPHPWFEKRAYLRRAAFRTTSSHLRARCGLRGSACQLALRGGCHPADEPPRTRQGCAFPASRGPGPGSCYWWGTVAWRGLGEGGGERPPRGEHLVLRCALLRVLSLAIPVMRSPLFLCLYITPSSLISKKSRTRKVKQNGGSQIEGE